MSADPLPRLRAARPPAIAWAGTADGHAAWQETERRGLDADFPAALPRARQARSSRRLALTVGALALVGVTATATVAVTGRSARAPVLTRVGGQAAMGRMPAAAGGAPPGRGRLLNPFGGSALVQPSWLPQGFALTGQKAGPSGSTWSQTWARSVRSTVAPGAAGCLTGPFAITVDQGPGVEAPTGSGDRRLAVEPVVGGVRATLVRTGDNALTLTWTPLALPTGGAVSVSTSGLCAGDLASLPTLLRVARGLK